VSAPDLIESVPAKDDVVAVLTIELVVVSFAADGVGAGSTPDGVYTPSAGDPVIVFLSHDGVVMVLAKEDVGVCRYG